MIFNFKMNRGGFGYRRAGSMRGCRSGSQGRKMAERVRYGERSNRELIRDCLEKHSDRFGDGGTVYGLSQSRRKFTLDRRRFIGLSTVSQRRTP